MPMGLELAEWSFNFVPQDIWVGVYWKYNGGHLLTHSLTLYICVLPMLCLKLRFVWFTRAYYAWWRDD